MAERTLTVAYHLEDVGDEPIMYFAGPTWHPEDALHWHDQGLEHLRRRNFAGTVCLPMPRDNKWCGDDYAQIKWQLGRQSDAKVIVFWMPRMGPVTNIEFGQWYQSGKIVLGMSLYAQKLDYIRACSVIFNIPTAYSLESTLELALERLS